MALQLTGSVIFSSSRSIVQRIKPFNIIYRTEQFLSLPPGDNNHYTIEFTGRNETRFQRQGTRSPLTGRLTTMTALRCVHKLWGSAGHRSPTALRRLSWGQAAFKLIGDLPRSTSAASEFLQ